MSVLPIVGANLNTLKLSEIALRQKSFDVDIENKHSRDVVKKLVEDLFETLYSAYPVSGVGLAAPQVGVLLRVAVIEYIEEREEEDKKIIRTTNRHVLINPHLTYKSENTVKGKEACLSFSSYIGEVERSISVRVQALDQNFNQKEIEATGWLARIFQHELDHLEGILYADRIEDLNRLTAIDYPYLRKTRATVENLYGKSKKPE
jgi:peptide deformylase